MSRCDGNNVMKRVESFYQWLQNEQYTMRDLIEKIVRKKWGIDEIAFSLGVVAEEELYFVVRDSWQQSIIDLKKKEESIEGVFSDCLAKTKGTAFVQYCRCIGNWRTVDKKQYEIYYFLSIQECEGISNLYFETVNDVYYNWIQSTMHYFVSLPEFSETYVREKKFKMPDCHQISNKFHEYMTENFDVDLSVITELSGSYYEKQVCRAELVFEFTDESERIDGIEFDEPIEINTENIRRIRKILQMGRKGQYLSIKWETASKKWMLRGLCSGEYGAQTSIVFKIIGHMAWEMELNGNKVICYECGKYYVDCEGFQLEKFYSSYQLTFKKEVPEKLKKIFRKAVLQEHGTIVVIWDAKEAQREIERLQEESTAMLLKEKELGEEYIESVTSIDGALCLDCEGDCYGIGVILDGKVKLKGESERGARFNSARRYVKQCQERKIACIAAVISEDKMVTFFETASSLEE